MRIISKWLSLSAVLAVVGMLAAACGGEEGFPTEQTAVNFESSYPAHNATLSELPDQIDLLFAKELTPDSAIEISYNGSLVPTGPVTLSTDPWRFGLSMSTRLEGVSWEGVYEVNYKACFKETGMCSDGKLAFLVDSIGN